MTTEFIKVNPDNLDEKKLDAAVKILIKGGLVSFPTETVYGLAANLFNKDAVNKVYEVKKRPKDKPLPVAIANKEKVEDLAKDILPAAYRLMDNFWSGPLTLILKSKESDGKIGIRIPNNNISLSIMQKFNAPIVLSSANISGNPAPCSVDDVLKDLEGKIDMVVDGGKTSVGVESTVLDATSLPFEVLRKGAIAKEDIDKITDTKTVLFVCTGNSCRSVMAKGLLEKFTQGRSDINVLSA